MTSSGKRVRQSSSPSWGCWTTWWVNPDLHLLPIMLWVSCPACRDVFDYRRQWNWIHFSYNLERLVWFIDAAVRAWAFFSVITFNNVGFCQVAISSLNRGLVTQQTSGRSLFKPSCAIYTARKQTARRSVDNKDVILSVCVCCSLEAAVTAGRSCISSVWSRPSYPFNHCIQTVPRAAGSISRAHTPRNHLVRGF